MFSFMFLFLFCSVLSDLPFRANDEPRFSDLKFSTLPFYLSPISTHNMAALFSFLDLVVTVLYF